MRKFQVRDTRRRVAEKREKEREGVREIEREEREGQIVGEKSRGKGNTERDR